MNCNIDDSERFMQSRYNVFDNKARMVVRRWIDSQGMYSLSVEDYGADIKAAKIDGCFNTATITRHELEVRCPWESDKKFPYDTVTIPMRKDKLFAQGIDDLFFWTISGDYKAGMYVSGRIVYQCPRIRKHTTRGYGDFFSVPLVHYKVVSLV